MITQVSGSIIQFNTDTSRNIEERFTVAKTGAKVKVNRVWPKGWQLPPSWEGIKHTRMYGIKARPQTRTMLKLRQTYYFRLTRRRVRSIPKKFYTDVIFMNERVGGYHQTHPKYTTISFREFIQRYVYYYLAYPDSRRHIFFMPASSITEVIEHLVGTEAGSRRAVRKPVPVLSYEI